MKANQIKRICAITLGLILGASVLTGCGNNKDKINTTTKQEITYNLGTDIRSLDPALSTDETGSTVILNTYEGLCSLDVNEKAVQGVAESWDISDDKLTYTFHLRKDAKWSNGDTVKASDFEYEWKRVLNPEIASEYAYQLLYIKGAKEYNSGKGNVDNVGVKAIDDNTLIVTLENPTPYFLELTATSPYMPVDKAIVEDNKDWTKDIKNYVSNGAFKVSDYKMKDSITLEKNENYFDKDKVKLDKINMKFVEEETSAWASYKSGQFDMVDTVPKSEIQQSLNDGSAKKFDNLATYFLDFNMSDKSTNEALKDSRVRKALSIAIDRDAIVNNVTKGGQTPAHGMVSKGINIDGKDYTEKTSYFDSKSNIEEAKKLLAEAGYPDGQGLPTITLLYNPEGGQGVTMEAIQDIWKKIGVNVELQSQEWKVFQTTRNNKQFEIGRDGWNADYVDPMTFLDMFQSTSDQNNSGYNNSEYDNTINLAKNELDTNKRIDLLHKAEDILMNDMPVIPLYYYTRIIGVKDYVKGYRVSVMGVVYFKGAYVEK
jgi:oligopeptide transport system substrate-binding protein